MTGIREYLKQGRPLLFDGAMGTYFSTLPGRESERCEQANVDHPEEILEIHRAYLKAGCRAIKTNTFSVGSDVALGQKAYAAKLVRAASRLAKEAAAPYEAYVFADLGPAPQGSEVSPADVYCQQADLFLEQGITHFLVETLATDAGIGEFARYLKSHCPEAFLIVSFAVATDGITREGFSGEELLRRTAALTEVDAVGFNCVSGPHHLLNYIRSMDLTGITLSVMPNAGYPTVLGRRMVFGGKPDYFGQKMLQIAQAGVAILGGCCGTTPEHIKQVAAELAQNSETKTIIVQPLEQEPRGVRGRNSLEEKLDSGQRIIAVELDPPVDDDANAFLAGVKALRDAGADIVTIADCPIGRPRADSSLLACKIKRELGMDVLPHMTCRDRNLNATKALLLGLSMEGVHNVLVVTGDPIPTENRDEVKSVYNFNSRKLARYVSSLNETVLHTPFRIFGALNVNAKNFETQLKIAQEKEACGVTGFLTQPVLSREALENLKLARSSLKGTILGGIFPVVSYRNACFLNNEISGMRVCDEIVSLYEGKDREAAEELAIKISVQVAEKVVPYTDGLYLMTPFHRTELMTRILERLEK